MMCPDSDEPLDPKRSWMATDKPSLVQTREWWVGEILRRVSGVALACSMLVAIVFGGEMEEGYGRRVKTLVEWEVGESDSDQSQGCD